MPQTGRPRKDRELSLNSCFLTSEIEVGLARLGDLIMSYAADLSTARTRALVNQSPPLTARSFPALDSAKALVSIIGNMLQIGIREERRDSGSGGSESGIETGERGLEWPG